MTSAFQNTKKQRNTLLYRYHAYGMEIESQLLIPELLPGNLEQPPKITICVGTVPDNIENATFKGVRFQTSPDRFLLKVDKIARYLIKNGCEIIIEPEENANESDIRLFLLGSAFGALFHQQGLFPFHGSAIIYQNRAILFSGVSGAGKSTLAASFVNKGYPMLTDDICMISLTKDNIPVAHPSYPQLKLWADSITKLGNDHTSLKKVRDGIQKFTLPLLTNFHNEPAELAGIYIVSTKNTPGITLEPIKGINKFNALKNNTYRLNFLKGINTGVSHFKHIETIARLCFVKHVERPMKGFHLDDLCNLIEMDFKDK
jgi:hypothetical protein